MISLSSPGRQIPLKIDTVWKKTSAGLLDTAMG
jgi:hypothetical protein